MSEAEFDCPQCGDDCHNLRKALEHLLDKHVKHAKKLQQICDEWNAWADDNRPGESKPFAMRVALEQQQQTIDELLDTVKVHEPIMQACVRMAMAIHPRAHRKAEEELMHLVHEYARRVAAGVWLNLDH